MSYSRLAGAVAIDSDLIKGGVIISGAVYLHMSTGSYLSGTTIRLSVRMGGQ